MDAAYPSRVHLTTMNLVGSRTGQWGAGLPYARCCLLFVLDHSCLDESEQVRIDLVLEGRAHAVWRTLVDLQRSALDQLG